MAQSCRWIQTRDVGSQEFWVSIWRLTGTEPAQATMSNSRLQMGQLVRVPKSRARIFECSWSELSSNVQKYNGYRVYQRYPFQNRLTMAKLRTVPPPPPFAFDSAECLRDCCGWGVCYPAHPCDASRSRQSRPRMQTCLIRRKAWTNIQTSVTLKCSESFNSEFKPSPMISLICSKMFHSLHQMSALNFAGW